MSDDETTKEKRSGKASREESKKLTSTTSKRRTPSPLADVGKDPSPFTTAAYDRAGNYHSTQLWYILDRHHRCYQWYFELSLEALYL